MKNQKTKNQLVNKMSRKYLIETLRTLLGDEFNAETLIDLTKQELMQLVIDAALWYQSEASRYAQDYK